MYPQQICDARRQADALRPQAAAAQAAAAQAAGTSAKFWVVVKIMIPFWVPQILGAVL